VSEEDVCCYICGKTPCEWVEFGVIALESVREKNVNVINTSLLTKIL
jgi:hypothetical protein